jgi:membrane-bound ClpP family serine protease
MDKKGEMSTLKAWLIVLASLIDDALVLAVIFIALWLFHVEITWPLIVIIAAVMVVFVVIMHKAVVPTIKRRKVSGAEGMIGMLGKVTETLKPGGTVIIKGEHWKAKAIKGSIEVGEDVEVVSINGLNLEVRKKKREL